MSGLTKFPLPLSRAADYDSAGCVHARARLLRRVGRRGVVLRNRRPRFPMAKWSHFYPAWTGTCRTRHAKWCVHRRTTIRIQSPMCAQWWHGSLCSPISQRIRRDGQRSQWLHGPHLHARRAGENGTSRRLRGDSVGAVLGAGMRRAGLPRPLYARLRVIAAPGIVCRHPHIAWIQWRGRESRNRRVRPAGALRPRWPDGTP